MQDKIRYFLIYRFKTIANLISGMDKFCKHHGIKFVEIETSVFPVNILKRYGFCSEPERKFGYRIWQRLTNQTHYVKRYS